jgi:hypothetical protein
MSPGRSWRNGQRRVETPVHLSADRLADMGTLPFTVTESATGHLFRLGPEQTSAERPSRPEGMPVSKQGSGPGSSEPIVSAQPTCPPDVVEPAGIPPVVLRKGRHRTPNQARFTLWGFALTFRRLELLGAVVLLVVVCSVLFVLS